MIRKFALSLFLLLLLGALPAAGQIDPNYSSVVVSQPASLMVCPAGDGFSFGQFGVMVLFVVADVNGLPVTGLNYKAFEIDSITPGAVADAFYPGTPAWDLTPSGFAEIAPGVYQYTGAVMAGGYENTVAIGKVQGVTLVGAPPMQISFVSPDVNGDGVINLLDIPQFAQLYVSGSLRADLNGDGAVNLIDLSYFAPHMGHSYLFGYITDPVD